MWIIFCVVRHDFSFQLVFSALLLWKLNSLERVKQDVALCNDQRLVGERFRLKSHKNTNNSYFCRRFGLYQRPSSPDEVSNRDRRNVKKSKNWLWFDEFLTWIKDCTYHAHVNLNGRICQSKLMPRQIIFDMYPRLKQQLHQMFSFVAAVFMPFVTEMLYRTFCYKRMRLFRGVGTGPQ